MQIAQLVLLVVPTIIQASAMDQILPAEVKSQSSEDHVCTASFLNSTELGVAQTPPDIDTILKEAADYMKNEVMVYERYESVRDICQNYHPHCAVYAALGECNGVESEWMKQECGPVCFSCDFLSDEAFCQRDPLHGQWSEPGDVSRMFERIISDPDFAKFTPKVHSRPNPTDPSVVDGPWIVTLENFITEEEAQALIDHGHKLSFEQSYTVGDIDDDEDEEGDYEESEKEEEKTLPDRKSRNTWCSGDCENDPIVKGIWKGVEHLTMLDSECSEPIQLLKYEAAQGEYYLEHLDWIDGEEFKRSGPRILTVFLYLNDVEEGGETTFTQYNISVTPKRGRAVLWPSVLDDKPYEQDERTWHEAKLVTKGVKYGANMWFHSHPIGDGEARCAAYYDEYEEEEDYEEADDYEEEDYTEEDSDTTTI